MSQGGKRRVFLIAALIGAIIVVTKLTLFLSDILQPYRLPKSDWKIYRENFISPEGRVIDTGNQNVSHSEGQGYGLLIALAYEDRPAFDRIWTWTRNNLQTRPHDKLLSWLWKPAQNGEGGAVADPNNASDGDLLVAWALVRASRQWKEYRYEQAAAQILIDLARLDIRDGPEGPYLLPGTDGFIDPLEQKKLESTAVTNASATPPEDPQASASSAPVVEASPSPDSAIVAATPVSTFGSESPTPEPTPEAAPVAVDAPVAAPTPIDPEKVTVTLNASYYIFPAFTEIANAFPGTRWGEIGKAGNVLVEKGAFGKWHLPPDWTAVNNGQFSISSKFPPLFGYNAVRVPLHLAWQNKKSPALAPFAAYWKQFGSGTIPATVDLTDDAFGKDPALPGMRAIATLTIHCVENRNLTVREIPVLTKGEPYFSASLTLLTKIAVRETFAQK